MEHRPYAPNTYAAQQSQQASAPAQGQYGTPSSTDRTRHSTYLQQAPLPTAPTGRAGGSAQQLYAQGGQYAAAAAMQQSPMQFSQEFQPHDVPRQQAQQYTQYGPNIMYMAQPQTEQTPYEQVPQYKQRPSAASETFAAQFGVPQAGQYYLASQLGPGTAAPAELPTQALPSSYQQPDPYVQAGPSTADAYPSAIMDPPQPVAYAAYSQQPQYAAQQQAPSSADEIFERYQAQIRSIFTLAAEGSLRNLGSQLLEVSHYLLDNVEDFGLTRDDDTLRDGRIQLWNEFNRAWLGTLQKQFDLTQEVIQTSLPLGEHQSLMGATDLERLSQELVRLCDNVERHGLVDYEMGVEEEQIMDLLVRCLDLLNSPAERIEGAVPETGSSAAGAAKGG